LRVDQAEGSRQHSWRQEHPDHPGHRLHAVLLSRSVILAALCSSDPLRRVARFPPPATEAPLTRSAAFLAITAGLAACGPSIAKSSASQSQLAPPDALACVMKQFEQLGFQRTMYDKDEFRTSARKVNPKITFSNNSFRKTWDRLEVEIRAGESGTDLKVTPSTAAEYFGQIGPYYDQLKTSDEATQAAHAVQQACISGSPAAPASQP